MTAAIHYRPRGLGKVTHSVMVQLAPFIGDSQLETMQLALRGEEGEWFRDKAIEIASVIRTMPRNFDTDGFGDAASADFYIVELDRGPEQDQAYGIADLDQGQNAELGYISIPKILACGAELDLHWKPVELGEILAKSPRRKATG